jgi:hypothetical protein
MVPGVAVGVAMHTLSDPRFFPPAEGGAMAERGP